MKQYTEVDTNGKKNNNNNVKHPYVINEHACCRVEDEQRKTE